MYLDDRAKHVSVEAPADPFSLEALIAWLRTKEAETVYCYTDNGECLIAQYFSERCDMPNALVGATFYYVEEGAPSARDMPAGFDDIAEPVPNTFGAALSRALSLQTEGR